MKTENLKIFYKILGIIINTPYTFKVTSNVTGAFFNFKIIGQGVDFINEDIKNALIEKEEDIFYDYNIKCNVGKIFSELNVSIPLM